MKYTFSIILSFVFVLRTSAQTATIHFDLFSLKIDGLELWNQSEVQNKVFDRKAIVEVDLGESLEGCTITLLKSSLQNVNMEMRFETSLTIMNEGPHCDLTEWKHYTSPWEALQKNTQGSYHTIRYPAGHTERFPDVSIDEVKKYVTEYCSGWEEVAQTISSIHDYPVAVGVSRYFLKITGLDKNGNEQISILTFNMAMGC